MTTTGDCKDADLKLLCQKFHCKEYGHPDEGGVPFMAVSGKDSELQDLWHDRCVKGHEVDASVSLNPDPSGPQLAQVASSETQQDSTVTAQPTVTLNPDSSGPQLAEVAPEAEQNWVVSTKGECSDADLKRLCQTYHCKEYGHPDEGGVPFLALSGRDSELQGLWHDSCVKSHEVDADITINPDPNGPQLAQVASSEEPDLVIVLKPGCTDVDVRALCEQFGEHHKCKSHGNPDEGGFGFAVMKPKQSDVQVLSHHRCVKSIEEDGVVSIPESGPQ